jgi:DNA polymerase V
MFGLIDCNNFYASCERVFRPDLVNKPIVVLSNNDGCVIARSNEAKTLGIPMGAPAFQLQRLFEQYQVHVFSANFALYGDMSHRVMAIISSFCPDIEVYSIDEAFLDCHNFHYFNLKEYGETIVKKVMQCTGIPISLGFASTKTLAKVANRIAKKFPSETRSVYWIDNEERRLKALKWLAIEDVWGIGRQYATQLRTVGVTTAYEFTQLPSDWVCKQLSIIGLRLQKELCGESTSDLIQQLPKKNIATTRSFDRPYTQFQELKERIVTFAVACAAKLRQQKSCCRALMIFVSTNRFRTNLPQYHKSIVVALPFATNSSIDIAKSAVSGLEAIFKEGYSYKKAGVVIMDFCPEAAIQHVLFAQPNPKHRRLMQTIDAINQNLGQQKVKLASQDKGNIWKMRQEKLSPRYTTRLSEVITIR